MAGERVRYICPICDQELKFGKHFCWNCKSRVEEPWRYTGGHLPNEGHEAGCHPAQTFMQPRSGPAHTGRTHGGRSLAGKNNTSKQYTYNRPGQAPNTARTVRRKPSGRRRPVRKSRRRLLRRIRHVQRRQYAPQEKYGRRYADPCRLCFLVYYTGHSRPSVPFLRQPNIRYG